ncbi:unnamed protein product, partial [Closterium sp. NIES-53]
VFLLVPNSFLVESFLFLHIILLLTYLSAVFDCTGCTPSRDVLHWFSPAGSYGGVSD